ncbi:polynucleotide adenylyltransferase [Sphingomonas spermidinifaciens]|uniref:Polynucleotide adenylyltransferase n=1 Tax=Sphingomonas spermidinifaciens TaxID=1141889 RepID=A0A2A4B4R3_9SPHN|nr:CCA tRNA nucleotidyltransferase [Sphingomonas spermidinifaciens]PCD02646.1 polynucleotide adenylyltransferase [Sphingomonas spermidinifaciens]
MAALSPDQTPWAAREGFDALVAALGEADMRVVGGAVRDTLLGLPVADLDVATRHRPEEVVRRLKAADIRAVPTGIAHGTVTAVLPGGPVEVTTLRRDVATDGRHATVAFSDDWREDAARRDFTINALYADPVSGELYDHFGGLDDLAAGRVRFIGNPLARIAEDHLRILRFFRFLARFGDTPDAEGLAACTARARDLMALSRERIADELLKLLVARGAVQVVALMIERAILAPVLPEITVEGADRLAALAEAEGQTETPPHAIRRLAALIPSDPAVARDIGARLRLSNVQRKRLESAVLPVAEDAHALAYRIGHDEAVDRLLLAGRPVDALAGWTPPRFPLTGGALIAQGLSKGPVVAATLKAIEDRWVAEGFPGEMRLEALTAEAIDQALSEDNNRSA